MLSLLLLDTSCSVASSISTSDSDTNENLLLLLVMADSASEETLFFFFFLVLTKDSIVGLYNAPTLEDFNESGVLHNAVVALDCDITSGVSECLILETLGFGVPLDFLGVWLSFEVFLRD